MMVMRKYLEALINNQYIYFKNKKVLLHKRKRHTARRIASTDMLLCLLGGVSTLDGGTYPGWGIPTPGQGRYLPVGWKVGTPISWKVGTPLPLPRRLERQYPPLWTDTDSRQTRVKTLPSPFGNNTAQLYYKLGRVDLHFYIGNFHRFLSVHVVIEKSVNVTEIGRNLIGYLFTISNIFSQTTTVKPYTQFTDLIANDRIDWTSCTVPLINKRSPWKKRGKNVQQEFQRWWGTFQIDVSTKRSFAQQKNFTTKNCSVVAFLTVERNYFCWSDVIQKRIISAHQIDLLIEPRDWNLVQEWCEWVLTVGNDNQPNFRIDVNDNANLSVDHFSH